MHTLHLRFLDDAGQWSGVMSQTFVKLPPPPAGNAQITAYRYWFDNNAAQALEVPVSPASEVSVLTDLPTTGLSNGVHTLHLRFLDDAGQWSGVVSQMFTKFSAANPDNKIAAYRYWLDFNVSGATEVTLSTPVELLVLDEELDFSAVPEAPHVLHFQFKDLNGAWSVVTSDTFNVGLPPVASFVPHLVPCKNGAINFQNTSSFATSWLWQFGDGGVSTLAGPTHVYAGPGIYTVTLTITDATTGFTATYSAPVTAQFLELQVQVNAEASSCFNSNDGAAAATASNGAAPFSFIWSTGQSGAAVGDFYPGVYTVTATASDGCTHTAVFTIANGSDLWASITVVDLASCPVASNGVAQIMAQAGVPPYTYQWSNGETTQTAVHLPVGVIGATVTDAAGCAIPASEIMGYDSDLTATTAVLENPACHDSEDGSARIDPLGGLAPYTFLWSNGETTALALQLPAGTSGATVTDAHGCAVSGSVNLSAPPELTAAVSVTDAACFGSSDGSATLTPAGGTPPYDISWSTGATGASLNNVAAGSYQATVTDDKGCHAVLPVTVQEPALLTLMVDASGISCNAANDGTATATPSGGTPPYDILWNNNATGTALSALAPGLYRATATDALGCIAASNEIQILEPPALNIALQTIDAPCGHDGGITSIVNGGTPPYNYAWSNGAAAPDPQMLDAGIYTVVVTDANDCTANATATVLALNHAPYVTFTGNPGFETRFVDPSSGSPYQTFRFEVRYFDADGDLPRAGYPRLYLDFEGDGQLTGSNDQIILLTETDPADSDPADGKDYYAVRTGIPSSLTYKTVVRAFDPSGCLGSSNPENGPNILKSADIFLFANDIVFSDPHPDPQETILVSATIHNESDFAAENFVCRLTNMYSGVVSDPIVVPNLAAKSSTTVSWLIVTPPDPGWNPMKVEIDATNLIAEPNELDNQAIRPFVNGDYNLPGSIIVDAAVTPSTSYFVSQTTLTLSGTAVYDGTAVPLPDPGCAGASVVATLLETGQTFAGFTDNNGYFVLNFPQPLLPGDYHISGIVTDYSLEGAFTASFSVSLPTATCLKPDLSCRLELDRHSLNAGESVQGYVQVSNTGDGASVATQLKILAPGASPDMLFLAVPALQPGATAEIPLPAIEYSSTGFVFVQAQADYGDVNDECHEFNNLSTTFVDVSSAIADIVPVSWNVYNPNLPLCNTHAFIYRIQNNGGAATGFFGAKLEVWSNGMLQHEDTQPVASISANSFTYHAFTYTFPSAGDYTLILRCDEPDIVEEYDEGNNEFTRVVSVYECPVGADLVFGNCQSAGVEPTDPQTPGDITLTAVLKNGGNAPATAPFSIQLRVLHAGPGSPFSEDYFLTINDDLDPDESVPVSFTVPKPPAGTNMFTLTADAHEQVSELNESNNTAGGSLDWNFSLDSFCCTSCMFWQKPVTTPNLWFSVGVFNEGYYRASEVPVQFEISGPGLSGWVNLGNAEVSNLGRTCGCPAGAGLADPFTFPDVGTYTVRMTVDPANQYGESDETDNVLTVQVTVRPDMQILSSFIAPSELHPDADEHIVFTVSYENTGFSNPADTMELKLLVDGFPLDSARVPGLLSGDHGTVQFPTSWASNLVGVHVARAIIDHDGEVTESNETNNEATRALVVGEAANFRFAAFSPGNYHPYTGQALTVTALIENNGNLTGTGRYQLAYVNDSGDTIPVYNKVLTLAAGQQQTVHFNWLVADSETILVGKIVNSTPQESRYDDNIAWAVLGGLELSVNTTPELCVPNTGTAGAVVSGGTPPYFYSWSNGQISQNLDGLNAGNYALTATDSEGRYGVVYFSIEQVAKPHLTFSVTNASCDQSDGSITLTVDHAAQPYDVAWNTGNTSTMLVGLTPARYTVSVTDAQGCEAVEEVIVAFDALQPGNSVFCMSGYPAVSPAQSVVNAGATQTISGRDFFLNGLARLTVAGDQAILANAVEIPVDGTGKFEYQLPVSAGAPQGQYRVTALDAVTGYSAPVRTPVRP
ncbi:MAG: PKD domain-containing protein [Thermoanaerobaculia bacterium]|nr:PKD domain-containing protein [Thermoanaerobaculia bacterium]